MMEFSNATVYTASHSAGKIMRELQDSGQREEETKKREEWNEFYNSLPSEQKEIASSAWSVGILGPAW